MFYIMKKSDWIVLLLFLLVSFFVLSEVVFNDFLIGRYIDYTVPATNSLIKNVYFMNFFTWWNTVNGGFRNSYSATLIPVNSLLYFPVLFGLGSWFITRYQLVLVLFLSMSFFYLLARLLIKKYNINEKYGILISIISSLFFILNNYLFCEITFGSNVMFFTFSFIPLLIYAVISFFETNKNSYFLLSLFSLIIIGSTLQHLIVAYVILFILFLVYKNFKFFAKLGVLHLLLSLYWILPLAYTSPEILAGETGIDYSNSLVNSASYFVDSFINMEYFGNRDLYNLALNSETLSIVWIFNAFVLLITSLFCLFKMDYFKEKHKSLILGFCFIFLGSLLFIKGGREPLGSFIIFLYNTIPFLGIFRSLQHYISFYVLGISVLFTFSSVLLFKIRRKLVFFLLLIVLVNSLPWWVTRDVGSDNIASTGMPSFLNQYVLTEGNERMYSLNDLSLDFSIMYLPLGYSVFFEPVGGNEPRSQGGDGGLYYSNKNFFMTDQLTSNPSHFLNKLEDELYSNPDFFNKYQNLFGILNINYFVLREDVSPLFSINAYKYNLSVVQEAVNNSNIFSSVEKIDFITIIKNKVFLPHVYTTKDVIIIDSNDSLLNISSNITTPRFVTLPEDVNVSTVPSIEFKKVNPTKYIVRVHNASSNFPLVFSESFHSGWNIYLKSMIFNTAPSLLDSYVVSEPDQASFEEVNNSFVSYFGSSFISKNYYDSIQNQNLPSGDFYDSWFLQPLSSTHLVSNYYSNTWIINPNEICSSGTCIMNAEGSYDFELIVEFWPQRLFIIGGILSSISLVIFSFYSLFSWRVSKVLKE